LQFRFRGGSCIGGCKTLPTGQQLAGGYF